MTDSIKKILDILRTSNRAMPAHFSSFNDRNQSFCIDFAGLTADDDYQLASEVYHSVFEFASKIPKNQITKKEIHCMLKIGEDLTIGAYMLQRTDRFASFSEFGQRAIEDNLNMFGALILDHIVELPMIQNYFDYCISIGRARADKLISKSG